MIPTGAFSFFLVFILHTFFRLDCFLFPYAMQFILLVICFLSFCIGKSTILLRSTIITAFFSHWFCLMILFSFLLRCNCKAMWLISSHPPVGGISGQINIFASHIVQVCFGFFFLLTGYKSQYYIVLHQFPFFHLIIVFWLEWKSTRQPLLIFSSICLFSFCCVFISISIFKIFLCAAVSVSLQLYAHCYLTVKFIPSKRLCYFVFILSLSFCSYKPVTLFIFGNNYYIHTCEGELVINWKEKKSAVKIFFTVSS